MAVSAMLENSAKMYFFNPSFSDPQYEDYCLAKTVQIIGRAVWGAGICTVGAVCAVAHDFFEILRGLINCEQGTGNKHLFALWKDSAMLLSVIGFAGLMWNVGPFTYQNIGRASFVTSLFGIYSFGVWGEFVRNPNALIKENNGG